MKERTRQRIEREIWRVWWPKVYDPLNRAHSVFVMKNKLIIGIAAMLRPAWKNGVMLSDEQAVQCVALANAFGASKRLW